MRPSEGASYRRVPIWLARLDRVCNSLGLAPRIAMAYADGRVSEALPFSAIRSTYLSIVAATPTRDRVAFSGRMRGLCTGCRLRPPKIWRCRLGHTYSPSLTSPKFCVLNVWMERDRKKPHLAHKSRHIPMTSGEQFVVVYNILNAV